MISLLRRPQDTPERIQEAIENRMLDINLSGMRSVLYAKKKRKSLAIYERKKVDKIQRRISRYDEAIQDGEVEGDRRNVDQLRALTNRLYLLIDEEIMEGSKK